MLGLCLEPGTQFCGMPSVATRPAGVGGAGHTHLECYPGPSDDHAPVEKQKTATGTVYIGPIYSIRDGVLCVPGICI